MNRIILALSALALSSTLAFAQTQPQRSEDNWRLMYFQAAQQTFALSAELDAAKAQIAKLQKDLDEAKKSKESK